MAPEPNPASWSSRKSCAWMCGAETCCSWTTSLIPARPCIANLAEHAIQGLAGIKDVVHEQHVSAPHIQAQLFREDQLAGFGSGAIAGDADEIEAQRQCQVANQVGQKHHRAIEQ